MLQRKCPARNRTRVSDGASIGILIKEYTSCSFGVILEGLANSFYDKRILLRLRRHDSKTGNDVADISLRGPSAQVSKCHIDVGADVALSSSALLLKAFETVLCFL